MQENAIIYNSNAMEAAPVPFVRMYKNATGNVS